MTILENFFFNPLRVNSKIQLTLSDISDDVSDDNWGIFSCNDSLKKIPFDYKFQQKLESDNFEK